MPIVDVCVIGAGSGGLVTLKECIENGLTAEAFEAKDKAGGVFASPYDGLACLEQLYHSLFRFP